MSPAGPAPWSPTTSQVTGGATLGSGALVREALSPVPPRLPVGGTPCGEEGCGSQSLGKWVSTARKGGGNGCGLQKRAECSEGPGREQPADTAGGQAGRGPALGKLSPWESLTA